MVNNSFEDKVKDHIKEITQSEEVEIVCDYSAPIKYEAVIHPHVDINECYRYGIRENEEVVSFNNRSSKNSPFDFIDLYCVTKKNDLYSFYKYQGFVINKENGISIIDNKLQPIYEDTNYVMCMGKQQLIKCDDSTNLYRGHIAFIKDNEVLYYNFLDGHKIQHHFMGKVIPSSLGLLSFYTIRDNAVLYYYLNIKPMWDNGNNCFYYSSELAKGLAYKDKKNITDYQKVKTKNDNEFCSNADLYTAIVAFEDETKRLFVVNQHGKPAVTDYVKDIKLLQEYIDCSTKEYEQETDENKEGSSYVGDDCYFVPGLIFSYVTKSRKSMYVVKNDGIPRVFK